MNDPSPFAVALRNLRGAVSPEDVAHAAGVSARTIHNYESGGTIPPKWRIVAKIGKALRRDVTPLLPLWEEARAKRNGERLNRRAEKARGGAK